MLMKATILYHPESEFSRSVETYAEDFRRIRNKQIDLVNLGTREGAEMARLYDIVSYPAVLVIRDNGELMKEWQSSQLPLMNEVVGYLE